MTELQFRDIVALAGLLVTLGGILVGIGVLIQAEEFPVRFDFATPIKTLEGDRQNEKGKPHFSFSAGYRF